MTFLIVIGVVLLIAGALYLPQQPDGFSRQVQPQWEPQRFCLE